MFPLLNYLLLNLILEFGSVILLYKCLGLCCLFIALFIYLKTQKQEQQPRRDRLTYILTDHADH